MSLTDATDPADLPDALSNFVREVAEFAAEIRKHDLDLDEVLQLVSAGATLVDAVRLALAARVRGELGPKPAQRIALVRRVLSALRLGRTAPESSNGRKRP